MLAERAAQPTRYSLDGTISLLTRCTVTVNVGYMEGQNTRRTRVALPTTIYWLVDVRPETLIHHPNGLPFYCGKTTVASANRLQQHRYASTKQPRRRVSIAIQACGRHIRIDAVEVVPIGEDWSPRERRWIEILRLLNPNCSNVALGGVRGTLGVKYGPEVIERMRIAKSKVSTETRAKIGAKSRGRKHSDDVKRRLREIGRRQTVSPETRARISATLKGKVVSVETRIKLGRINRGRKFSEEARRNMSLAHIGKTTSDETRAKMRASHLARRRAIEAAISVG